MLSGLGSFDPNRHRLTLDFKTVDKSSAASGEGFIPDDLAIALKEYVKSASAEQRDALEKAVSESPVSKKRITALKNCIKAQNPKEYKKIRDVFVAYAQGAQSSSKSLGKASAPKMEASAALPELPDLPGLDDFSPKPTAPKVSAEQTLQIQQLVTEINTAFGSELKAIEDITPAEIKEFMPVVVASLISKKEPFSEESIHKAAQFIKKYPDLVADIDPALKEHFINTSDVLKSGVFTRAQETSSGGVYMGAYHGQTRVVVKPRKEEYLAPYNPRASFIVPGRPPIITRGPLGSPVRRGNFSGDASLRERDAYVTDYQDGNFSKTPPTFLVAIHKRGPMMSEGGALKECSVQAFVPGRTPKKEDLPKLAQASLEAIVYADIDEGNADRHLGGNLFMLPDGSVQRIDQGMTRGITADECKFSWISLPQVAHPMTAATRDKIANQNLGLRLMCLKDLGLPKEAIELERTRILLKKEAAAAGLTFFDIGVIMLPIPGPSGSIICEFRSLLERGRASGGVEGEIKKTVENIQGWKKSVEKLHEARNKAAFDKHIKDLSVSHPYLAHILSKHIQFLRGKL